MAKDNFSSNSVSDDDDEEYKKADSVVSIVPAIKDLLFRDQGALLIKVLADDSDLQVQLNLEWESPNLCKILKSASDDLESQNAINQRMFKDLNCAQALSRGRKSYSLMDIAQIFADQNYLCDGANEEWHQF